MEDSLGARRSSSDVANTHGSWVSVGYWQEASVSHQLYPSIELLEWPCDMAAGFLQSEWSKREQGGSRNVFYDLASEVTLCHFCKAFLVIQISRSSLFIVGQAYTKVWAGVTGGHLGDWIRYLSFSPSLFLPETKITFCLFPLDGLQPSPFRHLVTS